MPGYGRWIERPSVSADATLEYHRLTAAGARDDPRLVLDHVPMDPTRVPQPLKAYGDGDLVGLPQDLKTAPASGVLDLSVLGRILFLSAGVVRIRNHQRDGELWFRAAGSAGNLAPLEVYAVTGDLPGLDAGVFHYHPRQHGLARLARVPAETQPALVITGVPWRSAWKYGERAYRHLWWDAGTLLAHTLELADDAGIGAHVQTSFVDREVARLVGAVPPHELPLVAVALGDRRATRPDLPRNGVLRGDLGAQVELPLITSTHAAGELEGPDDVARWRDAARSFGGAGLAPGNSRLPLGGLDEVILRRGSTRRFQSGTPAKASLLIDALGWACRPVPGDFVGPGSTLLEHHVAVHGVDGIEPGVYAFAPTGLGLVREGGVRRETAGVCLRQPLAAQGAYTAFHCARVAHIVGALGARAYRAAQLEAGIVEGRLHLAALALGCGATGMTFDDDSARRLLRTTADPMLATAVGVPAYQSRPGGWPGRPTILDARPR